MGEVEGDALAEEPPKKIRHRKKHLYNTILRQMEFYFSDANLSKDRFLSQLLSENSCVDVEIFLKFNKIRKLNCSVEDIQKALKKSELIELSEDGQRIYRKKPIKVKENVDSCTIYVENIKADANHETLTQIFSDFGNVSYVSIPKYKHNKANKGFAFIEYESEEQANKALEFFESINCKIPTDKDPEMLQSIRTFEGEENALQNDEMNEEMENIKDNIDAVEDSDGKQAVESKDAVDDSDGTSKNSDEKVSSKKRKPSVNEEEESNKKLKVEAVEVREDIEEKSKEVDEKSSSRKRQSTVSDEQGEEEEIKKMKIENEEIQAEEAEDSESKKKKKNKKEKRKNYIKELGMQVLSKIEWKKLRNHYLNLQRKKMKEFKQYLNRQKYGKKTDKKKFAHEDKDIKETKESKSTSDDSANKKLSFVPGVIVKLKLTESFIDVKKLKNDIKSISPEVKFVDIPLSGTSEEVYVRFGSTEAAKDFCTKDFLGEKTVLSADEETQYWDKIQNDRTRKFEKQYKKQRGREKLLKKAEKLSMNHLRFDENE